MKKLILPFVIITALFGCSKKNTPSPGSTSGTNITGKWVTTADTLYIYQNGVLTKTLTFTGNTAQLFDYQFNQNGTVLYPAQADPSNPPMAYYVVKGSDITFDHPVQVINGLTAGAYTQTATIKNYTGNKMELVYDETSTGNGITERDLDVVYLRKQN